MNNKYILSFEKNELSFIKSKMLNWTNQFSIFSYLDNNSYSNAPNRYEALLALGCRKRYNTIPHEIGKWFFGHVTYDYKNRVEPQLHSQHQDKVGFQEIFWFEPEVVLYIPFQQNYLVIEAEDVQKAFFNFQNIKSNKAQNALPVQASTHNESWQFHFSKEDYLSTIDIIQEHIKAGDCYEMNFCIEAFKTQKIDPIRIFQKLNRLNPAPFAAYYRNENAYLICASPERFLIKDKTSLKAQPIKGTGKRGRNAVDDEQEKLNLKQSKKDQAENIMIVDLMRNDMAKSCTTGSIQVDELFGIYTFAHVHQMISTVSGHLKNNISIQEILNHSFPMGSMTGAPKVRVMQLTEQYEKSRRGIFSGAVGYVNPDGDFDWNVVIRSLMYNEETHYLSYQTGGAITYDSVPEMEWDELKLKAKAMEAALQ